jgi:tyrosyl-tRNA synthetase
MWRYFELLSFRSNHEIATLKKDVAGGLNPRDAKFLLAEEIIARFHCRDDATRARQGFIDQFSKGAIPEEMPEYEMSAGETGLPIANLLKQAGLVDSTSEAMRMIKQGAVKLDGEKISDRSMVIGAGTDHVYQVGKRRYARVRCM